MDASALEGIGLTPVEIKVFVTLLKNGESKAGKIIKESNLQSSSVYYAINGLIKKGLISYIKKSEVKYYKATSPESVLDYIELKKDEYIKILPELKSLNKKEENEGVEFYKSYKGIRTLMINLLRDAKKGDTFRTFSLNDTSEYKEARERVFRYTKPIFVSKEIEQRGIFHEKNREKKNKGSIMKKRYLNAPLPPSTSIINSKVAIIYWKTEPSGILIHSSDLAHQYIEFFEHLWKLGKR